MRQPTGWTPARNGRIGAGPVHISQSSVGGRHASGVAVPVGREVRVELDQADAAQPPRLHDLVPRLDEVRRAAPLEVHLHDSPQASRLGDHGLPLGHVDADRLLDVHVGPRPHRLDRDQGVPVVGRRDEHHVEVALGEHLPVVAVRPRALPRRLAGGHARGGVVEHRGVDVAQRDDLDGSDLEEAEERRLAVPPGADEADAHARVGEGRGEAPQARQRQRRAAARLQERPSLRVHHFLARSR